jgi:chemotaxis protein methyltransferase CheR
MSDEQNPMSANTIHQGIEDLRAFVEEACGIAFGPDKNYLLDTRLTVVLAQSGASNYGDLANAARTDRTGRLRDQIIDGITTHETYWFRDEKPWETLRTAILPQLATEIRSGRKQRVRIWCAACSTGQEPYSLAILIDQLCSSGALAGLRPDQFEIIGTDISPGTLFLANAGRYSQLEINRGLPPLVRDRYFKQSGTVWVLDETIRRRISFRRLNLLDDLRGMGMFELILFRNVAIYFSDSVKRTLYNRLAELLAPPGLILLGASESLLGLTNAFAMQSAAGSIYYQKKI